MIGPKGQKPYAGFAAMLIDHNQSLRLNGFKQWLFYPGMAFSATQKWWGDYGTRDFPHEGIDFCLYEGIGGRVFHFEAGSAIPVITDGAVRAVFKDYLGHAIIVDHGIWPGSDQTQLSLYAHTDPMPHIKVGAYLAEGTLIATTADTRSAKASILPHLHFSLGLASPDLSYENFYWNLIREPRHVTLMDPLEMIDLPCHHPQKTSPWNTP